MTSNNRTSNGRRERFKQRTNAITQQQRNEREWSKAIEAARKIDDAKRDRAAQRNAERQQRNQKRSGK
jgi:hypothetical protein